MKKGGRVPCRVSPGTMLLGMVAGLLVLQGCSARLTGKPVPAGEGSGCLESHLANVEQCRQVAGATGTGRVQFVSDDGRGRASFDFVFRRPDSLRLQFLSPLGPAAAVLDLSGDHFLFADFRQGVYFSGHAGGEDFQGLTGLPVSPKTLISVLLAEPLPEHPGVGMLRFEELSCRPLFCELSDLSTGAAVAVTYVWPARSEGQEQSGCLLLPERVVFNGPDPGRQTTIRFKTVRGLSATEREMSWAPVDTSGLSPAVPESVDDADIPRWIN
jgi:outer membrane biogenesis lipoprotein LolB